MKDTIPVVLFTYNRPNHLRRTLECLRTNLVPVVYAFSDGPKTHDQVERVQEVRRILGDINWCEIYVTERKENLGLGKSILTGVTQVFKKHDALLVFEDDLVFVPGTYDFLSSALRHYQANHHVMSVTGWTHPSTTPNDLSDQLYFDGRTESWSWGTWARVWAGMEQDAMSLLSKCEENGIDIYRYGADLVKMARIETIKNIWAVRFAYLHILNGGLCLRPPHSMVEHEGFDSEGTNARRASKWSIGSLEESSPLPKYWPDVVEHPDCAMLWQKACGSRLSVSSPTHHMAKNGVRLHRKLLTHFKKLKAYIFGGC